MEKDDQLKDYRAASILLRTKSFLIPIVEGFIGAIIIAVIAGTLNGIIFQSTEFWEFVREAIKYELYGLAIVCVVSCLADIVYFRLK